MKDPAVIHLSQRWLQSLNEVQAGLPDGRWVPARPEGFSSIWYRIKATWLVWTGRADALIWPGQ